MPRRGAQAYRRAMYQTGDRLETPVRLHASRGDQPRRRRVALPGGRALVSHGLHAVVVAGGTGRPLGWATGRGLLGMAVCDPDLTSARDAIVERPVVLSSAGTAGARRSFSSAREPRTSS